MDMKIREWYVKIMYLLIKARSKTLHWLMSSVKIILVKRNWISFFIKIYICVLRPIL